MFNKKRGVVGLIYTHIGHLHIIGYNVESEMEN